MSRDLLNSLIDDAHDFDLMRRTLDMMSLDHLNHLLRCIDGVEELRRRPDHPKQHMEPESQVALARGRGRGRGRGPGRLSRALACLRFYMTGIIDI